MAGLEEGTSDVSFVGRDRELARVAGLLEARAGRGGLVLCTGEAGIGKTRFAEEIAATAAARGVAVVWARSAASKFRSATSAICSPGSRCRELDDRVIGLG